jgi:hypothetical protein
VCRSVVLILKCVMTKCLAVVTWLLGTVLNVVVESLSSLPLRSSETLQEIAPTASNLHT